MQTLIEDQVALFLDRKFRYSKSFSTKITYRQALKKFEQFLRAQHNLDMFQAIASLKNKSLDPIVLLDEFFTFLTRYKLRGGKIGYSSQTITIDIVVAKEFLNSQDLHIYNEDLKQKVRLPKKRLAYEEGLSKEILVRILHNSSPKLQTTVLMCASSGMRVGELVQLKISDIDFSTNPTSIRIRETTTKTRQTRYTCISSEAARSLRDYLKRTLGWNESSKEDRYIFMLNCNDEPLTESYNRAVNAAKGTLFQALLLVIKAIPELSMKNENGRNNIHFHAFRAWFKTQVTNAHQSDFAEALMGHTSVKLAYYRQNAKDRLKTYLEVEPALTISDFTKVEATMEDLRAELTSVKTELEKVKQWREISGRYEKIKL